MFEVFDSTVQLLNKALVYLWFKALKSLKTKENRGKEIDLFESQYLLDQHLGIVMHQEISGNTLMLD